MKDLLKNVFRIKDREKEIKEAEKAIDLSGDIGRICLAYPDFKSYRESYERTEKITIDALIGYSKNFIESPHGDLNKYAMTTLRLLTKLETIRYLVRSIESDSKKGLDNEKSGDQE